MPKHEIVLEYKHSHLNRPQLQQIIGAALQNRTEVDEIIVRCPSAAYTAHRVVQEIADNGHIRNSKGKRVKVTLATHYKGRS